MAENQHGLSRYIPAPVLREVRRRSKFGCVICRSGFYQYEHIDPAFAEATKHDPEGICCLCGSCHDAVTRGHYSKDYVKSKYKQTQADENVASPTGPLDFHDGQAELLIGGLLYSPAVRTVLRYHSWDLIRVEPGADAEPGKISAVFTDQEGAVTLQLVENAWVGSLDAWDIQVVGRRISVRRKKGEVALQLRLDPPGRVVVERLDMRFRSCHVLASEETYAVGRYVSPETVRWVHVGIRIRKSSAAGAAIEFTDQEALEIRDLFLRGSGQELATDGRDLVMNSNAGVLVKPLGIVVASFSGSFDLYQMAVSGDRRIEDMRRVLFNQPGGLSQFIGTGKM